MSGAAGAGEAPAYAELLCRSSFSFHEGASTPEELVDRAAALGLPALALTDRDGVHGLPRAWRRIQELRQSDDPALRARCPQLVSGARITVDSGPGAVLLVHDSAGWARLCRLLTAARCAGGLDGDPAAAPHGRAGLRKGRARLPLSAVLEAGAAGGLDILILDSWEPFSARRVAEAFGPRASVVLRRRLDGHDAAREAAATALARRAGLPLLASNDVLYHAPERRRLHDVLSCIRLKCTVDEAGRALQPNAARHLRSHRAMAALFRSHPEALAHSLRVARRCTFTLDQLAYTYPRELVPPGHSPASWLRHLTEEGLAWRYPGGVSARVRRQVDHELALIERLDFPAYFLTVWDTVRFAREQGILCQGRGSAANSAVCFALGITAVDPASSSLLFERFISEERGEPPDIDVDFEHERREEVIQYVYRKYGRHRAAMVCNIITYRRRSAIRDVGKALGLSQDQLDQLAGQAQWFDKAAPSETVPVEGTAPRPAPARALSSAQLQTAGVAPDDRRVLLAMELAEELRGHPRHLGLHSGGFTISDGPLVDLVPIEPASMENRTVLQWDKDDIDTVGFVKVDLLALGMLTCVRRCFDLVRAHWQRPLSLASVPAGDDAVYDMLCKADTVGVFQIESRAQMSMLPRLKPRCWYDLVVEVSIVRPGPIQGGMVHPYLKRRNGDEPITYAHPALRPILSRTAGVPIFQEQVMAMAVAVGGFTPGQADQLRRAMGAWRKRGGLDPLTDKLMAGMRGNGIPDEYAQQIANQIKGFGEYGFPESHAASFARLVYVSSWLKCHYPAAFAAALINSQPMGFYSPRAIVADARRHGVAVRAISVFDSDWDCTLEDAEDPPARPPAEDAPAPARALRLGLRLVKGLREAGARALVAARQQRPFTDIGDLFRRAGLRREELAAVARAGGLDGFGMNRREAVWAVEGLYDLPLFQGMLRPGEPALLPAPTAVDELREDFRMAGLSVHHDPTEMARPRLAAAGILSAAQVREKPANAVVKVAGIVSNRQRPGTASGIVFMTLEDETGMLNLVVKPGLFQRQRTLILGENMLQAVAKVQRDGESLSLLCLRFARLELVPQVKTRSRDFR